MLKAAASPESHSSAVEPRAYDAVFWTTYAANSCLMVAVSLLFRYSDFVKHTGGGELQLGLIVGLGAIGALAMRVVQGIGIDRFGSRNIWRLSLCGFILSCLMHLPITTAFGPTVFLARVLMNCSLAGAFGASIAFTSLRAPHHRMAEMIGMLGSSGFVGMAIGPALGDYLFSQPGSEATHVWAMFVGATTAGCVSLLAASVATSGEIRPTRFRQPSPWKLVCRYHPGTLLVVAVAMGIGLGLPMVFVRPFAESVGIDGIRVFFWVYAATAFSVRIATRRLPERVGLRPMILIGAGVLALGMITFLLVARPWMLAIPAVVIATSHAFLFPTVMAQGSMTFPPRYRGLATTLTLSMFDLGNLLGQPMVGGLIDLSKRLELPAYPTTFLTVGAVLATATLIYAFTPAPVRKSVAPKKRASSPSFGKRRPVQSASSVKI